MGVTPYVPQAAHLRRQGCRFGKQDFAYVPEQDVYRCPAGEVLVPHMTAVRRA
jgi:hypothetical protein